VQNIRESPRLFLAFNQYARHRKGPNTKVYIGGAAGTTSTADIIAELTEFGIATSNIKAVELSRRDDWTSLCVTILKEAEQQVISSTSWPTGITIRPFREETSNTSSKPQPRHQQYHHKENTNAPRHESPEQTE
jgi:hypothetical protein